MPSSCREPAANEGSTVTNLQQERPAAAAIDDAVFLQLMAAFAAGVAIVTALD